MKSKNLIIYSLLLACLAFTGTASAQQQDNQAKLLGTIQQFSRAICETGDSIAIAIRESYAVNTVAITKRNARDRSCESALPQGSESFSITRNSLEIKIAFLVDTDACATAGSISKNTYLCLYNDKKIAGRIDYSYDTTPVKVTLSASSGEFEQVTLSINDGGKNINNYQICYGKLSPTETNTYPLTSISEADFINNKDCSTITHEGKNLLASFFATSSSLSIENITNTQVYIFKARAVDKDKNPLSLWSNVAQATPSNSYSFADLYDPSPVNCNQGLTSASCLPLWGFLGLIFLGIRRKKIYSDSSKSLFIVLFLAAFPVSAHLGQLNLTIRGTPYLPNIDGSQTKAGATPTPYKCVFGKPDDADVPLLPLMGLDLDVHLIDDFGSLQVGAGIAYTYASGHALAARDKCTQTKTDVGLHIFHIKLPQVTYILDKWIELIPFAPYLRAGLVGAGYVTTFQGKLDSIAEAGASIEPIRFSFGWEAAAGFMFLLDVLDPRTAGQARGMGTFEHTYLKAEIAYAPINNFGHGGPDLSSAWPTKNIPLMLNFGLVLEFP